jgi:hypothetical protein
MAWARAERPGLRQLRGILESQHRLPAARDQRTFHFSLNATAPIR